MSSPSYANRRFVAAALQYALGRGANAVISITLFVQIARALGAQNYGAYVALIALIELLLVVGNLGSEWVTAVEVPRLSNAGAGRAVRRLIGVCLGVQALSFAGLALLVAASSPWLATWLKLDGVSDAFLLYAAVLFIEGLGRSIRDQLLSSLLLQWVAQLAQLLRNLVVMLGLYVLSRQSEGTVSLQHMAGLELGASALGLLIGGAYLAWVLHRMSGEGAPNDYRRLSRLAFNSWLSTICHQVWSGHAVVLLVTRSLGPEIGGLVGFARNMAEQVRRFMPIEFGFNLVRTFLVTRFNQADGAAGLLGRIAMFWAINALILLPVALVISLYAEQIAIWVGRGNYDGAALYLPLWLAWVFLWSHHRLSDTSAYLLGAAAVVGRLSLALLPALLVFIFVLEALGVEAAIVLLMVVELLYCVFVGRAASRMAGVAYPVHQLRIPRFFVLALLLVITHVIAAFYWPQLNWLAGVAICLIAYGLGVMVVRPLRISDLQNLKSQPDQLAVPI